ncbi:Rv3654c family TadE-like protein [Kribbella sp. NPDC048928]|uniref:Rv3654c family TadE-like protein n=1 Tax=Kribbella sp. NPDC048928 TaxID=3364111 RepID=UPI003721C2E0
MSRSERGSATLHVLFAAVLLFTTFAGAILWSAISTTRHKLAAAADLTALSAVQSLGAAQSLGASHPVTACGGAARAAALNHVQLRACEVTSTAVTVEVSLELDLRLARPTLTAIARAGPV